MEIYLLSIVGYVIGRWYFRRIGSPGWAAHLWGAWIAGILCMAINACISRINSLTDVFIPVVLWMAGGIIWLGIIRLFRGPRVTA